MQNKLLLQVFISIFIGIFSNIFFHQRAFALNDPRKNWKSITTPHFEIIYAEDQFDLARKYALRAEYTYSLTQPLLTDTPEKTYVIINDSTDLANGYATRIPFPHVMVYPVMPSPMDTIGEYGDWSHELFLHEYTHILSFEPAYGFMDSLRSVFGTIISPNMLMPRWWLEGFAVEYETRFSQHGRLRSVQQDAGLRALEIESRFEQYSIAEINESDLTSWPRGARPYLFGSLLMSELMTLESPEKAGELARRQGGRVPYFIEGNIVDLTNRSYSEWFTHAILSTQIEVQKQLEKLRQQPLTAWNEIDFSALESRTPYVSPNGQYLSLIYRNQYGRSHVKILDRGQENRPFDFLKDEVSELGTGKDAVFKTTTLKTFLNPVAQPFNSQKILDSDDSHDPLDAPPGGSINRISWAHDSRGYVYDRLHYIDSYNYVSDLYYYDLELKKVKPLTFAMRAREPSIDDEGKNIVFVHLEKGSTVLGMVSFTKKISEITEDEKPVKEFTRLWEPLSQHRISSPLFINSETLIFVERNLKGEQNLYKLSVKEGHAINKPEQVILEGLKQVGALQWTNQGILLAANENGTSNIYLLDTKLKNVQRLTHVETAAFESTYDPRTKELYATLMTADGFKVKKTIFKSEPLKNRLPEIQKVFYGRYPASNSPKIPSESDLESQWGSQLSAPTDYQSTQYLWPRYWLPFFFFSGSGYGAQISTSAQDPLGLQEYVLQGGWDTYLPQTYLSGLYSNSTTTWPWSLLLSSIQQDNPLTGVQTNQTYTKILLSKDLKPWSENISFNFGFLDHRVVLGSQWHKMGPELSFVYNSVVAQNYSPVPMSGVYGSITYNNFLKTKDTYKYDKLTAEGEYYVSQKVPLDGTMMARGKAQYLNAPIHPTSQTFDLSGNQSFPLANNLMNSGYILRGYDPNYLLFKSGINITGEYVIPLTKGHHGWGWGTTPLFFKRTRAHLFVDAMAVDGIRLNLENSVYYFVKPTTKFYSYGFELKFDSTVGYFFPMSWVIGYYYRPQYSAQIKDTFFFGLQM